MATEVKLPRLGQGMESGTIVKWLKSEGDQVEKGEALYELDTDKVTQEVEADASGVLLKIAIAEGEVEVGKTIAVIGEEGEQVETAAAEPPQGERRETTPSAPPRQTEQVTETREPSGNGRIKASPLAWRRPKRSRSSRCRRCGRRLRVDSPRRGRRPSSSSASPST